MSPRPAGQCTIADARARLREAETLLHAAAAAGEPPAIAAAAVDAALAAADAVCCVALRERAADTGPSAAVALLRRVDARLSAALQRALDRQAQAVHSPRGISAHDAAACLRQAELLIDAARDRVLAI